MNRIKKKGTLGIRGHAILFVLIGLLASEASSHTDSAKEEESNLKLKFKLLMNSYRHLCKQYSNLASNCSAPVINCTKCPDKWLHVGDQCFLLITEKGNWSNSSKQCKDIGGHLAILTNKEQHEAVEKEARRLAQFYTHYWIGLTDIEHEGHWKWVDNTPLTTSFWNKWESEPDDNKSGGAEGEDCVVVDSYTQQWNDVPCSFSYHRICQMEATLLV